MHKFQTSRMFFVALLALAVPLFAQQGSNSVVIHAGHVLDVKTGKLLSDQTIVIEDGKIVSVGGSADAKASGDAVRIDLPNATILPGLIDAHTHLTMDPKFGYEELGVSIPRQTLTGAKNARDHPCKPDSPPCAMSPRTATVTWPSATPSMPVTCRDREC